MKLGWCDCNQKWYRALNDACLLFWYVMMCLPQTLYVLYKLEAMAIHLNYLFVHGWFCWAWRRREFFVFFLFRKTVCEKFLLILITIVGLRFRWCRYCRFCRCWFWRRIIRRIKSINLITAAAATAAVINAILLQLLWWYWTTRTNVLTFYCNIIDRWNWRNLW